MVGCGNQIGDVRGETRIGKLAFARAESGEIKAHDSDTGARLFLPHVKQWANNA